MTRTIVVLAKAPVPGRVKTRLCPPCDPDQAARLAEAALADTLDAVLGVRDVRPVLALDGEPGTWLPDGVDVIEQRGNGLDERLACAFHDVDTGAVLIGMDTPQVTASVLESALADLESADAVLGPSFDGGWWAIGLHEPEPSAFLGVPMSTPFTNAAQLSRLRGLGFDTTLLPRHRDVDDFDDAVAVARDTPTTRFGTSVQEIVSAMGPRVATRGDSSEDA